MDLKKLSEPFESKDIEWRIQKAGVSGDKPWALVLAYVTNRAIMQRLDDVCGIENWKNEYKSAPDGGVMCGLSVRIERKDAFSDPDTAEWVTKWDGAENTNVEAVKGGLSNSMKRAAVQWGIGRYLYNLEATFVPLSKDKSGGDNRHYDKDTKTTYYWSDPALPSWALPREEKKTSDALITTDQVAQLVAIAKKKGATTKEEAVEFINRALLMDDFRTMQQSYFDQAVEFLNQAKIVNNDEPF